MKVKVDIKEANVEKVEHYGRFTMAVVNKVVTVNGKNKTYKGYGISRQADEDTYNLEKAEFMAIGRALKALGKKIKGKRINEPFLG